MELLRILEACLAAGGGRYALATVVETMGPAYRRAGARQLIREDRKTWGAITGGCVEVDLIEHALAVIEKEEAIVVRYSPSDDDPVLGLGSGCGGEIVILLEFLSEQRIGQLQAQLSASRAGDEAVLTVFLAEEARFLGTRIAPPAEASPGTFVQLIVPPLSLFLFGASPAAEPLAQMARQLGWKVHLADHRPAVAGDERYRMVDEIIVAPIADLPARFPNTPPSAVVVMTHHYHHDLELLKVLLPRRPGYIGVVGSRGRAEKLRQELHALGLGAEELSALHAPAGLDLGMDTPAEIALSIVAEIQAIQRGATATALRDRRGRIHDDASRKAIIILAAGGSRRMGQPKQLAKVHGKSLIRRAAETALSVDGAAVYVVVGAEIEGVSREIDELPVKVIVNPAWQEGIASSIRAGIDAVEQESHSSEAVALMLCDQPGVSAEVLQRLFQTHRSTRAPVVASRYPDGPGVPALFGAALFSKLKTLSGDVGAKELIRHLDDEVVTVPFGDLGDVDTPSDLALLL